MKVYIVESFDHANSEVVKVFKNKAKAEDYLGIAKRVYKLKRELRELDKELEHEYWIKNQHMDKNRVMDAWYKSKNSKMVDTIELHLEKIFKEIGADSMYSDCDILVKTIE